MSPKNLAEVARRGELDSSVMDSLVKEGLDPVLARAELLVHEVAHAVVFRQPFDEDVRRFVNLVGRRFLCETSSRTADGYECTTLAVEFLVLERFGWALPTERIVELAAEDLRVLKLDEAVGLVAARRRLAVNVRRVGEVVDRLGRYEAVELERRRREERWNVGNVGDLL